jgi:hypothetical protein
MVENRLGMLLDMKHVPSPSHNSIHMSAKRRCWRQSLKVNRLVGVAASLDSATSTAVYLSRYRIPSISSLKH